VRIEQHTKAIGVAIPHGLYNLKLNVGYVQIGTSHDTSQFAGDSIRYWWQNYGLLHYQAADSTLLPGRKVTKDFKHTMEIMFDDYLPQWNYTAKPQIL
jgi:hypothetical protein